ncbi:hypothetical protein GCM10017690_33330 [Microbacterium terregens]
MDESRARFDEGLKACQRLWSEEDVVWDAAPSTPSARSPCLPAALPAPATPPILVATAKTPSSCEAGRP